jgi:NADPH:quinone reductase-like Zn-dependent oxidoreductase
MTSIPKTYKKVVVKKKTRSSWNEATRIVEVTTPTPANDEVLVKIIYAGVQASDILQAAGGYGPLATAEPAEKIDGTHQVGDCGSEAVGEVVAVGSSVTALKVGDFVALSGYGTAFREYVPVKAILAMKVQKPTPAVVAILISGVTALGAIDMHANPGKGDVALVTAAAGGTGQFAVQLLKQRGCHVIGTCSTEDKVATLKELGCDRCINYKVENLAEVLKKEYPKGLNFVYEAVGGDMLQVAVNNLAEFGHLVFIGSVAEDYTKSPQPINVDVLKLLFRSATVSGHFAGNQKYFHKWPEMINTLIEQVNSGKLKVKVDPTPLNGIDGVEKAQALMRSGKSNGKVIVKIH